MAKRTCSFDDCDEVAIARGYCRKHYQRWRKHGDPSIAPHGGRKRNESGCSECGAPVKARGYCAKHYWTWWHWGDPAYVPPVRERATCSECDRPARALGYCTKHYRRFHVHGDPSVVGKRDINSSPRKHSVNHAYFAEISTPEQAYWLGFLTADGSIGEDGLSLELAEYDVAHLRKFAQAIGSDAKMTGPRQGCLRMRFNSRRLADGLASWGVIRRKTLVAVPPLERLAGLEHYYWRGLWDGDGTVSRRRNRTAGWVIGIVGSFACVDGFGSWACEITGSAARPNNKSSKNPAFWQWAVGGTRKPQLLAERLRLAGLGFGLDRKQTLLSEVCSFDLDEHEARWKAEHGVIMREVWASRRTHKPSNTNC